MNEGSSHLVNWKAIERAMKDAAPGMRRWVTKHASGMCGVGEYMQHWGLTETNECPRCGAPEDARHVNSCPSPEAQEEWDSLMDELGDWMTSVDTHPEIHLAIIHILTSANRAEAPTFQTLWALRKAMQQQLRIGKQGVVFGIMSREWERIQQNYYKDIGSLRTGRRWASLLVARLWSVGFHMWDHRNKCLHSEDNWANQRIARQADRRIRTEFQSGHRSLLPEGRALFRSPLAHRLRSPLASKVRWLELVQQEREAAAKQHQLLCQQWWNFRTYFGADSRESNPSG